MKKGLLFILTAIFFSSSIRSQTAIIGPEKGALVIAGGGSTGIEIWSRFIELAGGVAHANIIIVPTADEDSSINKGIFTDKEMLLRLGVAQVSVLHTRDPKKANTEEFAAPLRKATGIWFRGGHEWKLTEAYFNTLTQKEFANVLERGGVIGGGSAGAMIQGSFLLRGVKLSKIMPGYHMEGFDYIHHVAIDVHLLTRNRMFDLVDVIRSHPDLLGIGLDEGTAIIVQKDIFQVVGVSYVAIYDIDQINGQAIGPREMNNSFGPFYFLRKGQKFDLKLRRIIP